MNIFSIILTLLLFFLSTILNLGTLCSALAPGVSCNAQERRALLSFKQGLIDSSKRLASWSNQQENCCAWTGIHCSNVTGRVTGLDLRLKDYGDTLLGKISNSLLDLKSLRYLNLNGNDFNYTQIPTFLGSMSSLRHLDLGNANFRGLVPPHLGNLSYLNFLSLSDNNYELYVDSLQWVSNLSHLKHLVLDYVDLHKEEDWLQVMSTLPSLSELHLEGCELQNIIPPRELRNLTSLQVVDLSGNNFPIEMPLWLFNLTRNIRCFVAAGCSLKGTVPRTLANLANLELLDISGNSLIGPIPKFIGNLSLLTELYLEYNNFIGNLPESLGLLSYLTRLDISENPLEGHLGERHFVKLSNLKHLWIANPGLTLNVSSSWAPPFELVNLILHCRVGPVFPSWLRTQTSLMYLDMSGAGISDIVPTWFWSVTSQSESVALSGNQISGDISDVVLNSTYIYLNSNRFKGQLPKVSEYVELLDIDNNEISGSISNLLCVRMCRKNMPLRALAISNNRLSGELGDCWGRWPLLMHLNLANNQFSGKIPNSIGFLSELKILSLRNNSLVGSIPYTPPKFFGLRVLDLSENQLSAEIPMWMWELKDLSILGLRSNSFRGHFTHKLCQLASLRVLDLANNNLAGLLPNCFDHLKEMVSIMFDELDVDSYTYVLYYQITSYLIDFVLYPKGFELEYQNNVVSVRLLDLSGNKLTGQIPSEITSLASLHYLNLSNNQLYGVMPKDIGCMKSLEALDLSSNLISGSIPQSLSELSFLGVLNLSYNNLSGQIPTSTQLQSFDAENFLGNPLLCGAPLPRNCTVGDELVEHPTAVVANDDNSLRLDEFYIGVGVGFAVGFWGVCCSLWFNKAWRHATFRVLQRVLDHVYVMVVLKVRSFKTKLMSCFPF